MTFLVDSPVLLWWLGHDRRLSAGHEKILRDSHSDVLISSVTVAELELKASLGKLDMPRGLNDAVASYGFESLPFTARHAALMRDLPFHHRDPFDRMLISQAMADDLVFLTVDERCKQYDVVTR